MELSPHNADALVQDVDFEIHRQIGAAEDDQEFRHRLCLLVVGYLLVLVGIADWVLVGIADWVLVGIPG